MGIKNKVISWAKGQERDMKSWQGVNLGKIEREYKRSNGEMSEDEVMDKISRELAKTGKHLSDSEERNLKNELF